MTNEEAARILIRTVSRIGGAHDDVDQALQIAIYALCNATGNGIQFDKSLKTDCVADEVPCPHSWKELPNSGEKCDICGAVRYKGI